MTTELRPCPCGRVPTALLTDFDGEMVTVTCNQCKFWSFDAFLPSDSTVAIGEIAIDRWNAAPRPEPRVEREPVALAQ